MRTESDSDHEDLILRPRTYVTITGVTALFAMGALLLVRAIQTDQSWIQYLLPTVLLAGSMLAAINFLRLCYVRITDVGIERVNYLGRARHNLPLSELTLIDLVDDRNAFQQVVPVLVVSALGGQIKLSSAKYHQTRLYDASAMLRGMGVPAGSELTDAVNARGERAFDPHF